MAGSWSCKRCGAWASGFRNGIDATRALISHTAGCRRCPMGQTVSDPSGRIVWRKG